MIEPTWYMCKQSHDLYMLVMIWLPKGQLSDGTKPLPDQEYTTERIQQVSTTDML